MTTKTDEQDRAKFEWWASDEGEYPQPAEKQPSSDVAEALTELCDEIDKHEIHAAISTTNISWFKRKARAAIEADRQRWGEPVAWMYEHDGCIDEPIITTKRWKVCAEPWNETPLYNCPQPAEPSGAPTLHNKDSGAQDGIHAPQPPAQQPAPDVAQLVEALEMAE